LNPPVPNDDSLFRVAFDLAPAGMLAVDAAGRVLLANRMCERLLGYEPGEMIGLTVDDLVPARFRGAHSAHRHGFFAEPSARAMGAGRDLFALRRDGTEIPVEIGLNPVQVGERLVVIASLVDISARLAAERAAREAEERLRQTRKLESLGTLAGGIAHDFNNVLLAIVGYTELAGRQLGEGDAGARADLDQVLRAADRGRQLVQRILAFSRRRDLTRLPVRLPRVVPEALDLLRATLPSTIEIRTAIDEATPTVLADETQLHQVLLNLATNSAHAMPKGGTLEVRVAAASVNEDLAGRHADLRPGRYARLTVADTGAGIPPEVRERIFEPFFTTKPAGEGTGLGLSVILGIVRSFDGAIVLESEPGRGTRVDVWLPAHDEPAVPGTGPASAEHADGRQHVLFVEDEEVLAKLERRQLEALGYRVTVHTSSVEALDDFRRRPREFDLMVTDNTMPRMTGLQLAAEVSRLRPGLPILMVSGYADNADPEVLRASGIRATLRKPHTAKELEAALAALRSPE
jgi:hypothetical protein